MKFLLLGATGRTGSLVLETALEQGFQVHCLARNSNRIAHRSGLTVFEGNPVNRDDLSRALEGCEAVINTLNVSRTSDFPWAKLRSPETYLSDVMKNLLSFTEQQPLNRIVCCSAWGVAETRRHIPGWFRWLIDRSNIGAAYRDHERQERLLEVAAIPWTIVRPVGLSNSTKKETVQESFNNDPKPSLLVSRATVARYLVAVLERDDLIRQKVVISKK
ncbi:MAG: NAD(P)H-binding protein [Bacteroidota bacterium]